LLPAASSRSSAFQCRARKQAAAAAPTQQQEDGGDLLLLQVQAPDEAAGVAGVYVQYDPNQMELLPRYVETEDLLDGLDALDVQRAPEAAAVLGDDVQVQSICACAHLHCCYYCLEFSNGSQEQHWRLSL
jgi:hypothetical protein